MNPTPDRIAAVADALEAHLCRTFNATVVTKEDSFVHQKIADVFELARVGAAAVDEAASFLSLDPPKLGLPSGEKYLSDFGTTIGPVIALPKAWRAPDRAVTRLLVVPHEVCHVDQYRRGVDAGWWPKATSHSVLYLASVAGDDAAEYLGHVEGDAYAVGESVRAWLTGGQLRPVEDIVASLRAHYAARPAALDVATATLRTHYETIADGGRPNVRVAGVTLAWLEEHAADLKGAVTL